MCNLVWIVMFLLGWHGPADAVSWIAGDDSGVGDACTVLSDCNAGAPDFDDGSAYGSAGLVVEHNGVAGADIQVAVALVAVRVAGCGAALALMLGQLLLVPEGPAYRSVVPVYVGFLLGAAVAGPYLEYLVGQACDGLEVLPLLGGVVAVSLANVQLLACPGD